MSDLMPATTTISGNEYSAAAGATANGEGSYSHHQQQQTTKTSTSTIIGDGGGGTATSPNFSNPANMQTTATSAGLNLAFTNPKGAKLLADFKQIILELRAQNFDVIRFATYRTASKLRFIQKKLNLHLIDLWNVIETFRDNNFHTLDVLSELEMSKVEQCIQNMYIQLNKRLALNQQINVETQTQLLLAWLFCLYDKSRLARIKLFSLKVVLTTLCSGKLVDKLKYTFNQISEHNKNLLSMHKFDLYLRELLVLPKAVFEEPSFGYNDAMARSCFDANTPVRIEDFLSVALSDVGPPCFIWLNIFHRFINVQSVVHPVTCSACERTNFIGFRYKCQKCRKYQLCQDCFWRGRISHSHQLTHQMKEYTSYKSTAKQISNSLKRSFFCKPNKQVPPSSSSSMNNGPHTHHYHHQTPTSTTAAATKPGSIRTMPNYQQQTSRQTPTTSGNSKPMSSTTPTSAPYQMPPTSGSPLPPHQTQSSHHHHHHHHHQTGQQQQQPAITLLGGLQQPIPSVGANNSSSATAASNSALNNSDYNLIYGYQQSSHHHHQQQPPPKLHTHQTLSNITNNATTNGGIPVTSSLPLNPSELLYSKLPKSPKTKKLLVHTNGATSNGGTPILDDNEDDESSPTIHELSSAQLHQQQQQQQKSIDLTHLLPSVALNAHNELQQQQILRQQAAASSNTGNYSNTLSMTRTKNTDNINSTLNLFASFLLSNPNLNSTSSNGGVGINNGETVSTNNVAQTQQEEHNIIANYCSRLAQYYAQNPHLAQSSPTNTTSPTPQQQQQHQMQPPPAQPQMGLQSRTSSLSRQQQHHYQQSNRSKYSTLRPCQVPITTATAIGPTNRSLSESNFACNGDDEDETGVVNEYSLDDRLLKEKREIVAKLERQNREIAKEIKRLRMRQSSNQYLDLYSTDSSDYMSPSSAAAAAANSSSSSSAAAATIRYQQLLQQYQQQQQRSAAATAAAVNAYSNIYSTSKSRETTPATVKKPIDPNLIAELRNLKVKKGELDTRMQILINSRDQLMDRLAQLDLLIKTPSNTTTTATNNSQQQQQQPQTNKQQQIPATTTTTATTTTSSNGQPSGSHSRSWSTPSTPAAAHYEFHHPNRHVYNQYQQQPTANATTSTTNAYQQQQRLYGHYGNAISQQTSMLSLTGGSLANSSAGGLNDSIDSGGSSLRILRNDLLIAADSVTNAMQTLVNELNSEDVINDNFDRVTSKLENSENGHHYHHVNPTNLNGDSSNVINDGEEEAIYRLQQQQQQIYRNNIPTSSVSASATPVTYRKYHFHHQQQQQQQQQPTVNNNTTTSNTSNTHRNAINLDDFGVDYLSTNGGGGGENNSAEIHEISAQILNGFNSNVNNNNENNEDDIRAAYMESFIDELSKKEIISGLQMSCNPTEIDLDEVEQNLMMCNLGENSEQIAEWRRELEQVLTDQQQQQQQQNDSAAAQNNTKSSTIESNNNANTNNSN